MRSEYFILLGLMIFFPLILSRDPKLGMYTQRGALWFAVIGMCVPFWLWDVVATARSHWSFSGQYTIGVSILGLPVEEWLFFPIVGFVTIFTWESTKYFWGRKKRR